MSCRPFLPLLITFVLGMFPLVVAAEPRIGRTPDGTPYRVDAEGNQLADHIAELEVTIMDLRKQVASLEDELEKKQTSQIQVARTAEKESTALPRSSVATQSNTDKEKEQLRYAVESCERTKTSLESQLVSSRSSHATKTHTTAMDCSTVTAPLRDQITKLQTALMDAPSKEGYSGQIERGNKLEAAMQQSKAAVFEQDEKIKRVESQLSVAQEELSHLRDEISQRESREKELVQQISGLQQHAQVVKAEPEMSPQPSPVYSRTQVARAALVEAKEVEVVEGEKTALDEPTRKDAKKTFRSELSAIQALILKRKELLDSAKSKRRDITVKAQPLVTKNGDSLDTLRVKVDKVETKEESDTIRQGLNEIKALLDQDVSLLKRLS